MGRQARPFQSLRLINHQTRKMNYEEKQEARRERYIALAKKKRAESEEAYKAQREMRDRIPFGQPILIGHHSEKGHRRLLDRADNKMRKSIELGETADYYERRAENMSTAISSDDPQAVEKLKTKLAQLEDYQSDMKEKNAEARANKLPKPFMSFQLSNNNANIRTVKQRIAELEKSQSLEVREDIIGDGWKLHEDKEQNRIQFIFDGIPAEEVRKSLKGRGFRWSPYNKAWQRQLNGNGRFAAQCIMKTLNNQ